MDGKDLKRFSIDFLKKIIYMAIFFTVGLFVSNNNILQGFMDYFWVLVVGALLISAFNIYIKPKFQ